MISIGNIGIIDGVGSVIDLRGRRDVIARSVNYGIVQGTSRGPVSGS